MSKSKFKSINYSRVVCEGCGIETVIEPGREFGGLNCSCNDKPKLDDKEISLPVMKELDYIKTQTVTVIGRFENGDYEVCNSNDLNDTWRVPKDTFESTYEAIDFAIVDAPKTEEVNTDETPKTDATNEQTDSLSKGGDPLENTVTLSLEALKGQTSDEIAAAYNMDELRTLAKAVGIKSSHNMREDNLIGKLLEKAE
jgi:hypothetical protein